MHETSLVYLRARFHKFVSKIMNTLGLLMPLLYCLSTLLCNNTQHETNSRILGDNICMNYLERCQNNHKRDKLIHEHRFSKCKKPGIKISYKFLTDLHGLHTDVNICPLSHLVIQSALSALSAGINKNINKMTETERDGQKEILRE